MVKHKDLVSVIIPIYNVEQFFSRCIESVISQTYKNLEIILVDDGSTDHCGIIADKYAEKDDRIKVIHQKNGGLSAARNNGIAIATGKYITLVDSDDYIDNSFVETLLDNLAKTDSDISVCDYQVFEHECPQIATGKNIAKTYDAQDALKHLFYQKGITTSACAKLYKAKLFKGIKYPVGKICEDLATTYRLFASSKRICVTQKKLYFYLVNPNSIINSNKKQMKPERLVSLDFCEEIIDFADKNYPETRRAAINRLFADAIYILTDLPNTNEFREVKKRVWNIIKEYRDDIISDPESKNNFKRYAKISKAGYRTLRATLRAKNKIGDYVGAYQRKKTSVVK